MKSKGPQMPFFDSTKFSKKFSGQSINKIYNTNTTFKFPVTTQNTKYGGGFGVLALSFMKPKGTIYQGFNKPATMINVHSKPLNNKQLIGTKDYSQIQFPGPYQKWPAPLSQNVKTLKKALSDNTVWGYPMQSLQFPVKAQKYPAPTTMSSGTLAQIWNSKTKLGTNYGTTNTNSIQFPKAYQKYPTPLTQGNNSLTQIVQAGTMWNFPVNDKKFGK
jgi:hypothetical protein